MKQETKNLIAWIKTLLKREKASHIYADEKTVETDCDRAIKFLDSLPEIEKHLCQGGYIQDKNGIPCCDGDKVLYNGQKATLFWSVAYSRFFIKLDDFIGDPTTAFFRKDIEKVVEKDGL